MFPEFSPFFEKDINKLIVEISSYKNDGDLWKLKEGISNSGGNLTLHLIGNLNHFIGAVLDGSGYVRDRDKEFSAKDISREQIINELHQTSALVTRILSSLQQADIERNYPVPFADTIMPTGALLIHLLGHFNYHLGQINYHRRLIN